MLNEAGGIEADITVTRISEDAFYLITGAAFTHYVHERVITSFQSLHTLKPRYNEPWYSEFRDIVKKKTAPI